MIEMNKFFDLKVLAVAIITAFGWGGNYFTVSTKLDRVVKDAEDHVTHKEFAQHEFYEGQNIKRNEQAIQRIYEKYGWTVK